MVHEMTFTMLTELAYILFRSSAKAITRVAYVRKVFVSNLEQAQFTVLTVTFRGSLSPFEPVLE